MHNNSYLYVQDISSLPYSLFQNVSAQKYYNSNNNSPMTDTPEPHPSLPQPPQQTAPHSPKQPQPQPQPHSISIDDIILQNCQLLAEISMQSKIRRNKNILSSKMCLLINRLQRNFIRLAKVTPPECLGEPVYLEGERNRFMNFYRNRNGSKK